MSAPIVWSLEAGGQRRPLSAWGITELELVRASFAQDRLTLTVGTRDPALADLWAWGTRLVLWRGEVRWFTGPIIDPGRYGSGQQQGHTYVAAGPWWYLEKKIYEEERYMAANPAEIDSPLVKVFSSRAVLFNDLEGGPITPSAQAAAAAAYARAQGGYFDVGTINLGGVAPWEEATDITCAEVFKRSARYAPDAVQWCDYTPARPLIRAARREALDALTLDLAGGEVASWQVAPLHEARVPGVRFYFEDIAARADGSARSRYTVQEAGDPSAFGAVVAVIELGAQGTEDPEPVPAGLAAAYHAATSVLNYGGRITLKAREVAGVARPGLRLNLTGGRVEWETMGAPIQRVTEYPLRGETRVEFGAAEALGAQSFADYLRYQRLKQKSNYLSSRRDGEPVSSAVPPRSINYFGSQSAEGGGKGFVDIQLCPDGDTPARTIRVFAETLPPATP